LIVTSTKVEAQAVLTTFSQLKDETWKRRAIENHTYYDLGITGGVPVFMVQSEMGIGTPGGALITARQAIQDLRPQAVIMCGVAFGLHSDKQALGDILIAKQIRYYEPQKVDPQRGHILRGDRITCAERLLDRFRSADIDWRGAQTHFGLVMSGEKLVNVASFRDWILEIEPEAIGGEMEGAGLYVAAREAKVDWILTKGICDWADGSKCDDAQPRAALNAAQFVFHVLHLGGWGRLEQSRLTCPACSKEVEPYMRYCEHCGNSLRPSS
jgi:nucleoside phosphorylase